MVAEELNNQKGSEYTNTKIIPTEAATTPRAMGGGRVMEDLGC